MTDTTTTTPACPDFCQAHDNGAHYHEGPLGAVDDVEISLAAEDSVGDNHEISRRIYVAVFINRESAQLTAREAVKLAVHLLNAANKVDEANDAA